MRERQKRDRARELRSDMTPAERLVWGMLRNRQLEGFRFRRQHPIGPHIVDFACLQVRLLIEIDGGHHLDADKDRQRSDWLMREGFHLLRFWNNDVVTNLEGVRACIAARLVALPTSLPARGARR